MNKKLLNPSNTDRFMSDWLDELPVNTVINKGTTGCGATTLAIKQKRDTIIAVPFVCMIDNKVAQHNEILLGLHEQDNEDYKKEISSFLEKNHTLKIITTYDSLPSVCQALTEIKPNAYNDCHLVVDEWHILFTSYGYRRQATKGVLAESIKFSNVTFLSATPIEKKFWFPEIKNLEEWTIKWPNLQEIKTYIIKTPSPVKKIAKLCKNRIEDGTGANYHIFVNSVKGISEIIRYAGLSPKDVRVICASGQSRSKNEAKLPPGFPIETTLDAVKVINFYTATCFEGTDIYDKDGRTFIVCDPHKPNTMMDISTSMIQICGRIRDSKYRNQLTLIYNTSRYEDAASMEEFERKLQIEVEEAKKNAIQINGMTGKMKQRLIEDIWRLGAPFLAVEDDNIEIDQNRVNLDIVNYKIVNSIYKTRINLNNTLQNNGFKIVEDTYDGGNWVDLLSLENISFKDCCERYYSIKSAQPEFVFQKDERLVRLEGLCPEACDAVDKLGIDEIRRMKYHKTNIHKKLVATSGKAQDVKIFDEVSRRLHKNEAYTIPDIKKVLKEIYDSVGLKKTPCATDLEKWFTIKRSTKRINGKTCDVVIIEGDRILRI